MAFFKLPWSASKRAAEAKPVKGTKAARGETVDAMRRRARHRLMGAALLVVIAVVGFPVLFDSQPRSIPVDARIEIPDRNSVAPLVVPAAPASAPVTAASTEEIVEPGAAKPRATAVAPPVEPATSTSSAKVAAKVPVKEPAKEPAKEPVKETPKERNASTPAFVEAGPATARSKSDPEPVAMISAPSASEQAARKRDADRARALLEGRSGKVAAQAPAIPVAAADTDRFIVQVGAFSDESKVREARTKLERGGLSTYTQAIQTKDGKRTRVRVGPFNGRQDAETAAAKIKALGLPAAVLSL